MPITVNHVFTSPIADGTNTQIVRPSDWNSAHNISLSLASNEVIKYISAGTESISSGNVVFANSNGVSFGMNAGTITATVIPGAAAGIAAIEGGTSTATNGTVIFGSSAGNITFGLSNGYMTASAPAGGGGGNTMTISAANGTFQSNAITFANSNGISFSTGTQGVYGTVATNYQSQGAYLTTARGSTDAIGLNSALTANGVSMTANSSGLSLNFPAFLTTAALSNHSHGNPTLALTNLTGTTASASNGLTLSLSGNAAQTVQPVAASGSNGSFAFSTLSFGALNGLTFYTSNGSIVGSYTDGGGAGGGVAISAGTNSTGAGTVVFGSSAGNITFGMATDGYITASAPSGGGGGANTLENWRLLPIGNNTVYSSLGQNSLYLQHFYPEAVLQFSNIEMYARGTFVSSTNSKVYSNTITYGIYSQDTGTNNTRMTLAGSSVIQMRASCNSNTAYGFTISQGAGSFTTSSGATVIVTNISGQFNQYLPFTSTLQPNVKHAFGFLMSSATTVATGAYALFPLALTYISSNVGRIFVSGTNAVNSTVIGDREMGVYATTTGALPNSYATSQMGIAVSRAVFPFQLE